MRINLSTIPHKPGCYLFKDTAGAILYIGKAKNLKSRVSSYFHASSLLSPHKQLLVKRITKVEYIITSSEMEALLLESSLIKKHQPPYNIDLKDDKYFLYIKITTNEEYPRIFTVRKILRDRAQYFGPYVSASAVRQTLHLLRHLFPHRNFPSQPSPHQLRYLTNRYPELLGPSDAAEYRKTIERIVQFLRGHYEAIVADLRKKMEDSARKRQFEKAAGYRDKIRAIEQLAEKQKVVSAKRENQDIISLSRESGLGAINCFSIRNGKLLSKQNFLLKNTGDQTDAEALQAFIEQYYPRATDVPKEIIVPLRLPNVRLISKTFKVRVIVAQRGTRKQYLILGQENAASYLLGLKASWERDSAKAAAALKDLQRYLQLPAPPQRIEIFDISNIQGTNAVGSMVVFTSGQPDKQWYRKFTIKNVIGANDTAMMAEVLKRRFGHHQLSPSPPKGEKDGMRGGWPKPDLIILDGGRGQLSSVREVIPDNTHIAALAKKFEDVYLPSRKLPIRLLAGSPGLFLLQRMRDEAHRFAITFFRKRHATSLRASAFDSLPGLGPASRQALKKKYGTLEHAAAAPLEELVALVGRQRALTVKNNL